MERVFHFFFGNGRRTLGTLTCVAILFGLLNVDKLIVALTQLFNWGMAVAVPIIAILIVVYGIKTILGIKTK